MKHLVFPLVLLTTCAAVRAERDIVPIHQPLSLLGTELEAEPLGTDEPLAADVLATPTLVSSAYPEAIVAAIALPHRLYNAPEDFPAESNLLVLSGAKLEAAWGEERHQITLDFSKVTLDEHLGITLQQLCDLTMLCLRRSLAAGGTDGKPFDLRWLLPPGADCTTPSMLELGAPAP
jgi:hypothetical protein